MGSLGILGHQLLNPLFGKEGLKYVCVGLNGSTSIINCGSEAGLDDLHDAAFTAETWTAWHSPNPTKQWLFDKSANSSVGWMLYLGSTEGPRGLILCATAWGRSAAGLEEMRYSGEWYHVAMTWDDASYNYPRLWINGTEVTYQSTINRSGAVISDAAATLAIGDQLSNPVASSLDGWLGWARISNIVRYTTTFTPDARNSPPAVDANTIAQWNMDEGTGTTLDNEEGTATRDGTASNTTWRVE